MIQGFSSGLIGNRQLIYETDLPSFQRDFASLKTLDHGYGPAITFTRASNATYFDVNGVLQTASNDAPRFDHDPATGASRGLLIEEARTNSIRNSQAGGSTNGVIGSGGVMPTNWNAGPASGINREVVGTGTQNGMAYIDVRYYGTNSSGSVVFPSIAFDSDTQVVASSSQTWTGSFYAAIVGGTTTGINSIHSDVYESTSGGSFLANSNTTHTLTSSLARYSHTRTLTEATTARVSTRILLFIAGNATIDLTLRIAAPQLEQGAFPTSYIPTTTAAATRSADSAVVTPISGFYNQAEGTLFADFSRYQTAAVANFLHFTGTSPNQIVLETNATPPSTLQRFLVETSAGAQENIAFSGVVANTVYRMIGAYAANSFQAAQSGTIGTEDTEGALPTVSQMTIGAGKYGTDALFKVLNGHIRKIAYWPKRLSNTLLEQLTT